MDSEFSSRVINVLSENRISFNNWIYVGICYYCLHVWHWKLR